LLVGDSVRVDNQLFKATRKLNNKYGKKSKLNWSKTIYTVKSKKIGESGEEQFSLIDEKGNVLTEDGHVLWPYRFQLQKINLSNLDQINDEKEEEKEGENEDKKDEEKKEEKEDESEEKYEADTRSIKRKCMNEND
jgi:Ran GTPase-activating protein (RanGAP) involved in mRNA processing and transport